MVGVSSSEIERDRTLVEKRLSMNSMLVAGLVICMLSIPALAFSEASLSTNSLLWTNDSENSVLRSLYNDRITLSDLRLTTSSEITTEVDTEGKGSTEIGQSASIVAKKQGNGLYALIGSLSSSASGSGVSDLKSTINFQGFTDILNPWGDLNAMSKADVKLRGLTMARPGTDDYLLYNDANYNVITNVPLLVVSERWRAIDPKAFQVLWVADKANFDKPVDEMSKDMDLHFAIKGDDLIYGYDFSSSIENEDMAFSSQMKYLNAGVGE